MRLPTLLPAFLSLWIAQFATADIVVENDLINPEEIYDFIVLQDSDHWWLSPNTTQYFCIMRGLWNPFNHPKKYPNLARMSNPVMYSSTKQYLPWLINRATTWGVEKIAEVRKHLMYFITQFHERDTLSLGFPVKRCSLYALFRNSILAHKIHLLCF